MPHISPLQKYNIFWKRLLAGIIDSIIFLPFSIVDKLINRTEDHSLFISWTMLYIVCWTLYVVIGHGKYGQTVGKWVSNVKVFDLEEEKTIGYKRAFLREAVWLGAYALGILYFIVLAYVNSPAEQSILRETIFDWYLGITMGIWFILELVTMVFNDKRRALHDYIAGSVVIDINAMNREDLQKRHNELLVSLQQNSAS